MGSPWRKDWHEVWQSGKKIGRELSDERQLSKHEKACEVVLRKDIYTNWREIEGPRPKFGMLGKAIILGLQRHSLPQCLLFWVPIMTQFGKTWKVPGDSFTFVDPYTVPWML